MRKSRFSEEQIIGVLKEHCAGCRWPRSAADTGSAMRRINVALKIRRARGVGCEAPEGLEEENRKLRSCSPSRCWTPPRCARCSENFWTPSPEDGRDLGHPAEELPQQVLRAVGLAPKTYRSVPSSR